jgi:hypothetical protein
MQHDVARCAACGHRFSGEKPIRRWEDAILPYLIVLVLIGLLIGAFLWIRG